jgi:hypothetical protein
LRNLGHNRPLLIFYGLSLALLGGCASGVLKHKDSNKLEFSQDYDRVVKIQDIPTTPQPEAPSLVAPPPESKKKRRRKKGRTSKVAEVKVSEGRQPLFEDSEKMEGRRPLLDPFRVGEKVVFNLSYFAMSAGEMTLEVAPFAEVNGRKAYHFLFGAKSSSVFAMFYSVNDVAETFLDFVDLVPSTYAIHVKESKQLREVRAFWDYHANQANVWDKKVTKEHGAQEENQKWTLGEYAQNVFSAAFYMRIFQMYPGKKLAFYVADNGKNYLFKGEVLRREKLSTDLGSFDTVVMRPKFELDGMFEPVGDILFWMTDDDRKLIVRIESKIKIGTIVAKVKSIERGTP